MRGVFLIVLLSDYANGAKYLRPKSSASPPARSHRYRDDDRQYFSRPRSKSALRPNGDYRATVQIEAPKNPPSSRSPPLRGDSRHYVDRDPITRIRRGRSIHASAGDLILGWQRVGKVLTPYAQGAIPACITIRTCSIKWSLRRRASDYDILTGDGGNHYLWRDLIGRYTPIQNPVISVHTIRLPFYFRKIPARSPVSAKKASE